MQQGSQTAATAASAMLIVSAALWAILLAFPYWSYPHAIHTVLIALLPVLCLLLPVTFFLGYGARSAEAQALQELAAEAALRIEALQRQPPAAQINLQASKEQSGVSAAPPAQGSGKSAGSWSPNEAQKPSDQEFDKQTMHQADSDAHSASQQSSGGFQLTRLPTDGRQAVPSDPLVQPILPRGREESTPSRQPSSSFSKAEQGTISDELSRHSPEGADASVHPSKLLPPSAQSQPGEGAAGNAVGDTEPLDDRPIHQHADSPGGSGSSDGQTVAPSSNGQDPTGPWSYPADNLATKGGEIPRRSSPFETSLRLDLADPRMHLLVPEPFPTADTFRSNGDAHNVRQDDEPTDMLTRGGYADSFSFPSLSSEGLAAKQRRLATSLEPTRAAAGAFGSSQLSIDHHTLQSHWHAAANPLLADPSIYAEADSASSTPAHANGNHVKGITQGPLLPVKAASTSTSNYGNLAEGSTQGSSSTVKISPTPAGGSQIGLDDDRAAAGNVAAGSLAQAGVQSDSPQRAVNLPERAIEMPVSAARFGRIRSGRLGADSEGSDSSAASSPAKSRSTGSTMAGKNGVVPICEFMSPGESPLGAIRAGRLGE